MTKPIRHMRHAGNDPRAEWARCKAWIESALARCGGTHEIEDIEAGIAAGHFHFWPGDKSAAVTEIHQFPRARFLHVFLAGGDLDELRAMVPDFVSWGRFHRCSRVTLAGRPGWERALKEQGWKPSVRCLALPIVPEPQE